MCHNIDGCMAVKPGVKYFYEYNYNYKYQQILTSDESLFCNISFTNVGKKNPRHTYCISSNGLRSVEMEKDLGVTSISDLKSDSNPRL